MTRLDSTSIPSGDMHSFLCISNHQISVVTFNDYSAYTLLGGSFHANRTHRCYGNSMAEASSANIAELLYFLNTHSVSGESRYEYGIEKAFELLRTRRDVISHSEYCVKNMSSLNVVGHVGLKNNLLITKRKFEDILTNVPSNTFRRTYDVTFSSYRNDRILFWSHASRYSDALTQCVSS